MVAEFPDYMTTGRNGRTSLTSVGCWRYLLYVRIMQGIEGRLCIKIIELIDIERSRREILEAFGKSPDLNITYCKDLKIGTLPHHFRKRNIIKRAENSILS